MRAVAAIPAIGLLVGSAGGLIFADTSPVTIPTLLACAVLAVAAWRANRPVVFAGAVGAAFAGGGALLSAAAWRDAWRPPLRIAFEDIAGSDDGTAFVSVTGVLRSDAVQRPAGVSLSVDVQSIGRATLSGSPPAEADPKRVGLRPDPERVGLRPDPERVGLQPQGGLLLTVAGELARDRVDDWRAGRTIRAPAQLRRPSRYLNPGVPDEERALARRGTVLVGSVKSGALVEVVSTGSVTAETAWRIRSFARRAIARSVGRWSPRSAAIVTAIVIGDRAGLDDELQRRLQEAGTYHVIAISGGNIAILAGLTIAVFRVAGILGPAAMLTAIISLVAYAYVVGGGASVARATLMAVIYFAGRAIDLRGPPANTLALAAGVLVASQPLAIADPAFLLTFGATGGILAIVPSGSTLSRSRLAAGAALILASSLAAEAALLPVGARLFSRVTFAGLALNFAAIPLMAVAQVAGMAAVILSAIAESLAAAAGWLAYAGADGLVRSAELVDLFPVVAWRVAPPHWIAVAAYYGALLTLWFLDRPKRPALRTRRPDLSSPASSGGPDRPALRLAAYLAAAAAAAWILFEPARLITARGDGALHLTFMDVGQGDATLVQFPRGHALLVDSGGLPGTSSFDIGDRVVGAVLRHSGIRRLDAAVITHGDADHAGGLASVLRDFRPRDVWEGIPVPRFAPLLGLRRAAIAKGSRWTNVQANDRFTIDDVEVIVRHPGIPDWERQDVRNDDSIVLELRWRDVSVVLTGDIGRETERAIAPLFAPAGIRVLKVPHHGSLTSSSTEFLDRLAPRVAIISAGRHNPFGHPAPEVVKRYQDIGAQIFRTDQDGAVMLDTDGYSVKVASFVGRSLLVR